MRILMISPQPFFEPRGAPFCVYQHIKALITLGYEVDLVTYHVGKDIDLPGLRIFRAPKLPFIQTVKAGPSREKVILDGFLFLTAFGRLLFKKYRYLHTHEEAAMMGIALSKIFRCKHLYYMHCDLPELIAGSGFVKNKLALRGADFAQKLMLRRSDSVVTFYPGLEETAKQIAPEQKVYMILPPPLDEGLPAGTEADAVRLRHQLQLGSGPVLLYTGTLENYQGLDILLQSVGPVTAEFPDARYVIVGGKPEQVEDLKQQAQKLGIMDRVRIVGQRPLEEMPHFQAMATILLSPRNKGTHTPLKLYTYLRSGVPILATSILSNTQILTPDVALLVQPTAEGLTEGALTLLRNPTLMKKLGSRARQVAEEQYSWPAFLEKNRKAYSEFQPLTK
ncbi:glycosyltransferase [Tengunoibacter tsumagoiensis]|uniref:Glycoside hydrolase n=1 Tax=Tengunoibacter tsumagoiensis TaxID=2014871 RepID=A0A401ZVZ7_9CHLR|nr:glycosyltransferase [Tengunoibacter tsumagoiensis]GCE10904.1 glycoside hydrolase [Tengunoibacter tsumagoiensis]